VFQTFNCRYFFNYTVFVYVSLIQSTYSSKHVQNVKSYVFTRMCKCNEMHRNITAIETHGLLENIVQRNEINEVDLVFISYLKKAFCSLVFEQ